MSEGDKKLFASAARSLSPTAGEAGQKAGGAFFNRLLRSKKYFELARGAKIGDRCCFTGILNHRQLRYFLPCVDVLAAPSIFPEAFGMVGIEAMACGVWPILTFHSGFREIHNLLRSEFQNDVGRIKPLRLNEEIVFDLADTIVRVLTDPRFADAQVKEKLSALARGQFSWESVARRYLEEFEK